jgi:hypothetical protein
MSSPKRESPANCYSVTCNYQTNWARLTANCYYSHEDEDNEQTQNRKIGTLGDRFRHFYVNWYKSETILNSFRTDNQTIEPFIDPVKYKRISLLYILLDLVQIS